MKTLLALACMLACSTAFAFPRYSTKAPSVEKVSGYTKANGTHVESYKRTGADNTKLNNWSSKPNVNPYTGKAGTKNPYAPSYGH